MFSRWRRRKPDFDEKVSIPFNWNELEALGGLFAWFDRGAKSMGRPDDIAGLAVIKIRVGQEQLQAELGTAVIEFDRFQWACSPVL